jgi:superfamily II DNA or RNA helicase
MLRSFQQELIELCVRIRDHHEPIRDIFCDITPGGGKSSIGPIVSRLIPSIADKICWVVPRKTLADQAEMVFIDPVMRSLFGHHIQIRKSDNTADPTRGYGGYATLYQGIAASPDLHRQEFDRFRYILFLDEPHHLAMGTAWQRALQPLVDRAVLRIYASGTFERGDQEPIAFLPYVPSATTGLLQLDFPFDQTVTYHRRTSLTEHSTVPLYFDRADGAAHWQEVGGNRIDVASFEEAAGHDGPMLSTVLQTEYARTLLQKTVRHWQDHKRTLWPQAKLLVVAPFKRWGKQYAAWIRDDFGLTIPVVDSDDTPEALKTIKRFKQSTDGSCDALMTCQMAYEGLDVPAITHIACLTRYRTAPWIYQCFARACRTAPGKSAGYIFVPDDPKMREIIETIKLEQLGIAKEDQEKEGKGDDDGGVPPPGPDGPPRVPTTIIDMQSKLTTHRAGGWGGDLSENETLLLEKAMQHANLHGLNAMQLRDALYWYEEEKNAAGGAYTNPIVDPPASPSWQTLTPSEEENQLKAAVNLREKQIDAEFHGRIWGTTASELWRLIGKERGVWGKEECREALDFLALRYPPRMSGVADE